MTGFQQIFDKLRKLQKDICCFRTYNGISIQSADGDAIYIIPHGINGVTEDSFVYVRSISQTAMDFDFSKVATIDTANITITYATPPDVGTNNLKWGWFVKP